ncbi:MAG: hypothetical protein B7Z37_23270 [Verrucomicrobia bacterium 12-59-8]|nr:MAG: hypothetical protein B7Z37_23270 [Verrucomicrobia bacterium 12-59-8]
MDKFLKYLEYVLVHEGGYQADKRDPGNANGGATNFGVTQAVYNEYLASSGKKPQSVAAITRREVEAIYRVKYWLRIKGDELPLGWDYAAFDLAVNSGTIRAIKFMQELANRHGAGLEEDGVMGAKTVAAIRALPREALDKYIDMRLNFMRDLKAWDTFGKGWTSRVEGVRSKAKSLLK